MLSKMKLLLHSRYIALTFQVVHIFGAPLEPRARQRMEQKQFLCHLCPTNYTPPRVLNLFLFAAFVCE
jgi:hypothetical protein